MAFFRSFFENSAHTQDESFPLESLPSNVGAGSSPVMVTDAVPLDNPNTAPMVAPANTVLMDEADATPIVTPTNTILMDINATTDVVPPNIIPMDANMLVMNANTMLSAIPANTLLTPATLADTMPMEADTSLAAVPASTIPMDVNTIPVDAGTRLTPAILTDDNTPDLSLVLTSSNFKELTPGEGRGGGGTGTMILHKQSFAPEIVSAPLLRQGLKEVKQQTAAQSLVLAQARLKDATIVQQSQALQKLQRDLGEVQDHVLLEAKAEIQRLQVDRESEILALNNKYEMTLHQLQELQSRPPRVSDPPPSAKYTPHPRSTLGSGKLICHSVDEEWDQEQLEAPASVSLNPSNHTLQEMNTDPPLTSSMPSASSTPSRREKQWIQNLAHVRDLFKMAFKVTQDEDFLQCGGASSQVTKVFVQGTGPGPDPSHLQWDFNHPASSPWNQAVISQLMCLLVICDRIGPLKQDQTNIGLKYQHRKDITKAMVAVKEAKGDDDIVAWWFLHSVITKLGSDGMSSEDSDGEDTKTIFCMHTLPWRRDIVKELNLIDQQRLQDSSIFSPRGAKAAKHIRCNNFSPSERKAVEGLPRPFYDESWLAQNKGMALDEHFWWMTVYAQN
ncbi:hypothetical protein F5141DRAFT_1222634 [Pisolithus sp. B1]|nr:hypothetical protein F5141DRAFT_1222634 [Pisolithus sp. B1]